MADYTPKELKAAVAALNEVQPDNKIAVVAKKTVDIEAAFRTSILDLIAAENTDIIPDSVIDFYNDHIAEEDDGEVVEDEPKPKATAKPKAKAKPAGKAKPKPKASGKASPAKGKEKSDGKKDGKKDGKAKPRTRDKEGVVAKAVEAYQTEGIRTTKELTAHLAELFPDRNISSTVSHVCCILAHVQDI